MSAFEDHYTVQEIVDKWRLGHLIRDGSQAEPNRNPDRVRQNSRCLGAASTSNLTLPAGVLSPEGVAKIGSNSHR
jgi:hypothetical protein